MTIDVFYSGGDGYVRTVDFINIWVKYKTYWYPYGDVEGTNQLIKNNKNNGIVAV